MVIRAKAYRPSERRNKVDESKRRACIGTRENNDEKGVFENIVGQRGKMHIAIT